MTDDEEKELEQISRKLVAIAKHVMGWKEWDKPDRLSYVDEKPESAAYIDDGGFLYYGEYHSVVTSFVNGKVVYCPQWQDWQPFDSLDDAWMIVEAISANEKDGKPQFDKIRYDIISLLEYGTIIEYDSGGLATAIVERTYRALVELGLASKIAEV